MAVILWATGLSLLLQGCLCSIGQTDSGRGCLKWTQEGADVCCVACYPGNRLVKRCGPSPKDLCTPCEPNTYTVKPRDFRCTSCTQCIGVQVLVKECTITTDTQCSCKKGLTCGDARCSFCVLECGKGQEPAEKRSCRPCPNGTFSDQIHQMCKPWSTKCPNPDQHIIAMGSAISDIKCANISTGTVSRPKPPNDTEQTWPLVLSVVTSLVLMSLSVIVILSMKIRRKRKDEKETKKPQTPKTLIIRTPTDDPQTLQAIECSFHEAQQEQGSSSESLASKESSDRLLG